MGACPRSRVGRDDEAGFTLVELLVVLAVVGLLIAAAPAIVSAARPGAEAKATAFAIANDLRAARARAIVEKREVVAVFDIDRNSYTVKPGGELHTLPRALNMTFATEDFRSDATEDQIRFFSDGSSTGGALRIISAKHIHRIVVYPLMGRISVDE